MSASIATKDDILSVGWLVSPFGKTLPLSIGTYVSRRSTTILKSMKRARLLFCLTRKPSRRSLRLLSILSRIRIAAMVDAQTSVCLTIFKRPLSLSLSLYPIYLSIYLSIGLSVCRSLNLPLRSDSFPAKVYSSRKGHSLKARKRRLNLRLEKLWKVTSIGLSRPLAFKKRRRLALEF